MALAGNDDDLSNSLKKYGKTGPVMLEFIIDGDILLTRIPFFSFSDYPCEMSHTYHFHQENHSLF